MRIGHNSRFKYVTSNIPVSLNWTKFIICISKKKPKKKKIDSGLGKTEISVWRAQFCMHLICIPERYMCLRIVLVCIRPWVQSRHVRNRSKKKNIREFFLHCALLYIQYIYLQIYSSNGTWCLSCNWRYTNMDYYFYQIIVFAVICVMNLFAYSYYYSLLCIIMQ